MAGGAEGNRTPDLCSAIAALSHLSYSPAPPAGRRIRRVGPLGKRLPSRLSAALQSPVPQQLRPADLRSFPLRHNRNGGERLFVSSLVSGRCLTGLVLGRTDMAYDRFDTHDERS